MASRPIPAFYCCYLLRSIPKPNASPYVGSTPHILRRWKQHNGLVGGGAFHTARLAGAFRPWEVTCIVYGFPSQVAALQFEWAWQHAHLSRHITPADRLANPLLDSKGRRASKRATISSKVADLHSLLHSQSFARWPLSLRFFSADTYQAWRLWDDRAGNKDSRIRLKIDLALDETNRRKKGDRNATDNAKIEVPPVLEAIDVGYSSLGPYLDKTSSIVDSNTQSNCSVCKSHIKVPEHAAVVCPHHGCNAISHLTCLAKHASNHSHTHEKHVVPLDIHCPECKRTTPWVQIVQELTLRTNGGPLVQKTLKKWRKGQSKAPGAQQLAIEEKDMDEDADAVIQNDQDDSWIFQQFDDQLDEPFHAVNNDTSFQDIDEVAEVLSDVDDLPPSAQVQVSRLLETAIVIPDSDWDNVEVLE
jgi:structure-specific endonuclease subunit SLX1